jgi:hypothetical protein
MTKYNYGVLINRSLYGIYKDKKTAESMKNILLKKNKVGYTSNNIKVVTLKYTEEMKNNVNFCNAKGE